MTKFQVGDYVEVIKDLTGEGKYIGDRGYITEATSTTPSCLYYKIQTGTLSTFWAEAEELKMIQKRKDFRKNLILA